MSAIRQILISTIALAVIPQAALLAADTVEYLGGTVKSIPANSTGSLNLGDPKELRFNYGASVYKLPYGQITNTQIIETEGRHLFGRIPLPTLRGRRKDTLAISYKDPAGASGTLNFELYASQAEEARETIAEKKSAVQTAGPNQPDEWWGDKYWKTNRNKATWEAGAATAVQPGTPAPVGTK